MAVKKQTAIEEEKLVNPMAVAVKPIVEKTEGTTGGSSSGSSGGSTIKTPTSSYSVPTIGAGVTGFNYADFSESDYLKALRDQAEQRRDYTESERVGSLRDEYDTLKNNKIEDWTGGTYGDALRQAIDKINNREKFTYDINGDALYQLYKDQYINNGRIAMNDTIGKASAMTGGYGNSYATTAGNQTYQEYLKGLNDKIPELYKLARDAYDTEGKELYDRASLYNNMYNQEYGQYRDKVSDYNTALDRAYTEYANESNTDYGRWSNDRDFYNTLVNNTYNQEYGQYSDNRGMAFNAYQSEVSQRQHAAEMALKQAQFNAEMQYKRDQLEKEYNYNSLKTQYDQQIKDTEAKYEGYMSPEIVRASNSAAVKTFDASIMTPSELQRHGNQTTVGGKQQRFDNYTQYVDSVLENWYKSGKLSENEVAYLKGQYGL